MSDCMLPGFALDEPDYSRDYVFSSLTYEIENPRSPLRRYFDCLVRDLRGLQSEYRSTAGSMLVKWSGVNAGTLGAAFDFVIRFRIDSAYDAEVARHAFTARPHALGGVDSVIRRAQIAAAEHAWDELYAACWALALFTEVYRVGLAKGSPLRGFLGDTGVDVSGVLAATPAGALVELADLRALAETRLLPSIEGPSHLGPTFSGSEFCRADADLVDSGCLLELKTTVGVRNSSMRPYYDPLPNTVVFQLLGYALFDLDNRYGIERLGIYSSRYGHLTTWQLSDFLERIACRPVDIEEERARIRYLLSGQVLDAERNRGRS